MPDDQERIALEAHRDMIGRTVSGFIGQTIDDQMKEKLSAAIAAGIEPETPPLMRAWLKAGMPPITIACSYGRDGLDERRSTFTLFERKGHSA